MNLQPKLPSLDRLRFLASRQPVDTFYRASDLALGHFEALVFVPPHDVVQCRLTIAHAFKSVLDAIVEYGDGRTIDDIVLETMKRVASIISDIQQHAEMSANFDHDIALLTKVLQDRPKIHGSEYTIINKGTTFGQTVGSATINFGHRFPGSTESGNEHSCRSCNTIHLPAGIYTLWLERNSTR